MIKIDEFTNMTDQEKVDTVNGFCDGKKTLTQINKENFDFTNVGKHMPKHVKWNKGTKKYEVIEGADNTVQNEQFSKEEIIILKKMIGQQKTIELMEKRKDDEVKNRSINVYQKQYRQFAKWCKENRITQHDALYTAIKMLMEK